jgi:CTP synthase
MKYIVITGGVISGLGKGITASSIGILLKNKGYSVTSIKIDPYLNIDAGTMSPLEHGEVFVLNDGTETDLDLGNYERFLNIQLHKDHNITSGNVFQKIINDERKGKYIGETVQIIPHVTNKIQELIKNTSEIIVNNKNNPDICIIELGGTIGDMESIYFVEALRQMNYKSEDNTFCFIHISMIINNNGEDKTKPTQNSVSELRRLGINPNILILRSINDIPNDIKSKISLHSQVKKEHIFINKNCENIYQVPIHLNSQNIIGIIEKTLNIENNRMIDISFLHKINNISLNDTNSKNIAIIGKYTKMNDTYLSIHRALEHASYANNVKINIKYIDSEEFEDVNCNEKIKEKINNIDGIVIPGGFGVRGIEGMINVISYCRENNIPTFGICLGMQIMCIEAARNVLGKKCISVETLKNFDEIDGYHSIIIPMEELNKDEMGGTMKLGLNKTFISDTNTLAYKIYKSSIINERHRHRYEVNPKYIDVIERNDLYFSGKNEKGNCMDIVEDKNHKFYLGTQFHPEFKSSIENPCPLFKSFILNCM